MKRQSGFPMRWPLWLALLLLWAMPAQADKQVLSVAWSHWPPFSQLNNKGELAGLDISLTRQILTKAGFTPKFREIPWARALHLVEHGQLDIAMGALALPEREQYARFSAPYRHSAYVLLSNDPIPGQQDRWAGYPTLSALCNAKGLKIGKLRGTRPMQQLENCPALKEVTEYNADDRLIDLLLARRLDGVIMEWQYARYRLDQLGATGFISCQLLLHHQPVSLMFAKESISDEQLVSIDKAIATLPKTDRNFPPPTCRLSAAPDGDEPALH